MNNIFTKEELEYINTLNLESISLLEGLHNKKKLLFDFTTFSEYALMTNEELNSLNESEKEFALWIHKKLNEAGIIAPNKMDDPNYDDYCEKANAYLLGLEAYCFNEFSLYRDVISLSNEELKEKYKDNLDDKNRIISIRQKIELTSPGLLEQELNYDDDINRIISIYDEIQNDNAPSLNEVDLSDFEAILENPQTKAEMELQNYLFKKLNINKFPDDINNFTELEAQQYFEKYLIIKTALIDKKNGLNYSTLYRNNLSNNDLTKLNIKEKNAVSNFKDILENCRCLNRTKNENIFYRGYDYSGPKLENKKIYTFVNKVSLKAIEEIEDREGKDKLLEIKRELVSKYPEPSNFDSIEYTEYSKKVENEYIDKINQIYFQNKEKEINNTQLIKCAKRDENKLNKEKNKVEKNINELENKLDNINLKLGLIDRYYDNNENFECLSIDEQNILNVTKITPKEAFASLKQNLEKQNDELVSLIRNEYQKLDSIEKIQEYLNNHILNNCKENKINNNIEKIKSNLAIVPIKSKEIFKKSLDGIKKNALQLTGGLVLGAATGIGLSLIPGVGGAIAVGVINYLGARYTKKALNLSNEIKSEKLIGEKEVKSIKPANNNIILKALSCVSNTAKKIDDFTIGRIDKAIYNKITKDNDNSRLKDPEFLEKLAWALKGAVIGVDLGFLVGINLKKINQHNFNNAQNNQQPVTDNNHQEQLNNQNALNNQNVPQNNAQQNETLNPNNISQNIPSDKIETVVKEPTIKLNQKITREDKFINGYRSAADAQSSRQSVSLIEDIVNDGNTIIHDARLLDSNGATIKIINDPSIDLVKWASENNYNLSDIALNFTDQNGNPRFWSTLEEMCGKGRSL